VYENAKEAIEGARQGKGPTLLECLTYRWFGHHVGDPGTSYRPKEEVAKWKARDPSISCANRQFRPNGRGERFRRD